MIVFEACSQHVRHFWTVSRCSFIVFTNLLPNYFGETFLLLLITLQRIQQNKKVSENNISLSSAL